MYTFEITLKKVSPVKPHYMLTTRGCPVVQAGGSEVLDGHNDHILDFLHCQTVALMCHLYILPNTLDD